MRWKSEGLLAGLIAGAMVLGGCSGEEDSGSLRMALQSTSPTGTTYRLRQAAFEIDRRVSTPRGSSFEPHSELFGDSSPSSPLLVSSLPEGEYRITLRRGWFLERIDPRTREVTRVDAELIGDARQRFRIAPGTDTFVTFQFAAGGDTIVIGDPGQLVVGIDVIEDGGIRRDADIPIPDAGTPPDSGIPDGGPPIGRRRNAMIETNQVAVSNISLADVFNAIGTNNGTPMDGELLYQAMIDSYASRSASRHPIPSMVRHCDADTAAGSPSLNGFPIRCDRLEVEQFGNLSAWFPIAIVNRVDLAPADGAHCGQQRLIFANNAPIGNGRMFIIVEAQIPNPDPGCGVAACQPIAELWDLLADQPDANFRGTILRDAFLGGLGGPFGPFITAQNLSVGAGQIRTNNFNDFPWTLREFKVLNHASGMPPLTIHPFPVADAPHGPIFNDTAALPVPVGADCRRNFLSALDGVLSSDPAEMAFITDAVCNDSESQNDFTSQDYERHLADGNPMGFALDIEGRIRGTGLTPRDIAARARFSGSCIGCHEESNFADLGGGVTAPSSLGFVHVGEFGSEDCGDGSSCFPISDALQRVFLPRRSLAIDALRALPACGAPPPPPPPMGGEPPPPMPPPRGMPSSALPREALFEMEREARASHQGLTLGGLPASIGH